MSSICMMDSFTIHHAPIKETAMTEIHGFCDPRFEGVREAFAEGFRSRNEIGAAAAATVDGEPVVDLWAGHADPARSRPWREDTLVHVYSVTKGITALCAHRLIERGALDLDAPAARYWPEFAQKGKGDIPVRWLLSHRAGLPALRAPLPADALYDQGAMAAARASAEPCGPPGQIAYHPMTFGWLVGELVRRVDGRTVGRFFREEIAEPLGIDFHIGLGPAEEKRAAEITDLEPPPEFGLAFASAPAGELPLVVLAFANPSGSGDHNSEVHRRAEIPAMNGHGTARALARLYGTLACGGECYGVRLLAPASIERLRTEQARDMDPLLGMPLRMGLGFWLSQPNVPGFAYGPNEGAFGHPGAGGSLGFADPSAHIGFGYVTNRMGSDMATDPRPQALIDALYAAR
jgi:CubicO group peptidase (beta-lactamase class C family)